MPATPHEQVLLDQPLHAAHVFGLALLFAKLMLPAAVTHPATPTLVAPSPSVLATAPALPIPHPQLLFLLPPPPLSPLLLFLAKSLLLAYLWGRILSAIVLALLLKL